MDFVPFELEEWQSRYETTVAYNLADSGVSPVRLDELVPDAAAVTRLLAVDLHYPPVGGTETLRQRIAEWHAAEPDNVLVTVGAAEANAITIATLVHRDDHVVVMEPGYRQVRGCALNAGARVDAFPLDPANEWRPDLEAMNRLVTRRTRLIAVTNPNNPVGTILTEPEMDAVVAVAERSGAWILADEVYRGTERLTDSDRPASTERHTDTEHLAGTERLTDTEHLAGTERLTDSVTPSFFGRYDRVVCVGSLSKAFGLAGLRTGWLVAPADLLQAVWRRHEYATISTGRLSMYLAEIALEPAMRAHLLGRTRALIRAGYARLERWIDASNGLVSIVPPAATALGFVRYAADVPSLELAQLLRTRADVLVGAGAHFGVERHLRITHGLEPAYLDAALHRISAVLETLSGSAA